MKSPHNIESVLKFRFKIVPRLLANMENKYAPGGVGAKRAREEFEGLVCDSDGEKECCNCHVAVRGFPQKRYIREIKLPTTDSYKGAHVAEGLH